MGVGALLVDCHGRMNERLRLLMESHVQQSSQSRSSVEPGPWSACLTSMGRGKALKPI